MQANSSSSLPPRTGETAALAAPITWAETVRLIRSDFARLSDSYGGGPVSQRLLWFIQPNFQALFLYRIYRYLFVKGWRRSARVICLFSLYVTGAEIPPTTSIGPACLVAHAYGVILCGRIGSRFTVYGQAGTGGGLDREDIGGGPGLPVVGDDVTFAIKAVALGPIRIGDRVNLGPAALVTRDMPDDSTAISPPSKIIRVRSDVAAVSPILSPEEAAL